MSALHSRADVPELGLLPNQLSLEVQPGTFAPDMALCPLSAHLEQQGGHRQVGIVMLGRGIPIAQGWHRPFSLMSCPGADKLSIPFRFLFSQTCCFHLTYPCFGSHQNCTVTQLGFRL